MAGRTARSLLTVVVNLLIFLIILLSIRQLVLFSGQIAAQSWAKAFDQIARHLAIPFGQPDIRTPYHGVFDVDNALTILVVVLADWGLSAIRDRA